MFVALVIWSVLMLAIIITSIVLKCCYVVVRHRTTMMVERLGRFHKLCRPGRHDVCPIIDHIRKMEYSKITVYSDDR